MTSDQYVESVKQMMNQQNIFFGIFIAILGIVLAIFGYMQWRLSEKQLQGLKETTQSEIRQELETRIKELEKNMKMQEDIFKIYRRGLVNEQYENFNYDYQITVNAEDYLFHFILLFSKYKRFFSGNDQNEIPENLINYLFTFLRFKSKKERNFYSAVNKQEVVKNLISCLEECYEEFSSYKLNLCIKELQEKWLITN